MSVKLDLCLFIEVHQPGSAALPFYAFAVCLLLLDDRAQGILIHYLRDTGEPKQRLESGCLQGFGF